MNKIVFIVGMAGSGKSLISDEFVLNGFSFVRFGQTVLDLLKERNLPPGEASEKQIREELRKTHGMAVMALLNIPKFDELLKNSNVVGDGLYSWSEYKLLKEKYGDLMRVIAVFAPPKVRYERLSKRKVENDPKMRFRSFTVEEARARDYNEIENVEKGGPIAMADFTIINMGSINEAKREVRNILNKIND
jgi:dephospho-CoA kinase